MAASGSRRATSLLALTLPFGLIPVTTIKAIVRSLVLLFGLFLDKLRQTKKIVLHAILVRKDLNLVLIVHVASRIDNVSIVHGRSVGARALVTWNLRAISKCADWGYSAGVHIHVLVILTTPSLQF